MRFHDVRAPRRAGLCVGTLCLGAIAACCGLSAAGPRHPGVDRPSAQRPAMAVPTSDAHHTPRPSADGASTNPAADASPVLTDAPRGSAGALRFEDAAAATGLIHAHGTTPSLLLLAASHAAGGAAGDFNGDGRHDLFVLGGGTHPDRMFIANADGTFSDMTAAWGLERLHHAYGASAADFDKDGDLDLFITSYGPSNGLPQIRRHMLLRNDGDPGSNQRSFVNIADSAGLNSFQTAIIDGTGSGWGDYDLDGDLDLMVCAYRNQHAGNRMYRNDGPDGQGVWRFTDVTVQAGLSYTATQGFLPRFADMNGDRYPELLLIADTGSSKYFVNNTDGTFTLRNDLAGGLGTANAMGVDVGDVNNDGLPDWYVTNIAYEGIGNVLLVQNPDGSFTNRAADTGVWQGYWGWGTLINDFDHDGHLDIAETNGGVGQFANRPSLLYLNDGDAASFQERGADLGFVHHGQGRGLIRMDIDDDGDMDMVIICNNQPMGVFRNTLIGPDRTTPPDANWLRVVLDTGARATLAPEGIGSVVRLTTSLGQRIAQVDNASNHCTTSPAEAHLGLGAELSLPWVRVEWADGTHTTLMNVDANRVLRVAAPAHPADFDASGVVDAADALAFVQAFLASDLNADIDANFTLNFFDVARFVDLLRDGL
jgi:hypothetical protein